MKDCGSGRDFRWRDGVTLKEHFDCRLDNYERELTGLRAYVESRLAAMEKATEVALTALDRRLDGMNEFRDALKDQSNQYATREGTELQLNPIRADIRVLRESKANIEGQVTQHTVNVAFILASIGASVGIIGLILNIFVK